MDASAERHAAARRRARSAKRWKGVVAASATIALSVVLFATLRDRRGAVEDAGVRTRTEPSVVGLQGVSATGTTGTGDLSGAPTSHLLGGVASFPPQPDAPTVTLTSADLDAQTGRALAAPDSAASAPPPNGVEDAAVPTPPQAPGSEPTTSERRSPEEGADAAVRSSWAPSMSAGAGAFVTEAPPWSASAFPSNPSAGAGRFLTDAPPWSGSAFPSNPNAGAGPFTTERNLPAWGAWTSAPVLIVPR